MSSVEERLARLELAVFGSTTPVHAYPDPGTVGVDPQATRTDVGSVTVTKDGTVLRGLNIRGSVTIRANNVLIEDCWIEASATAGTSAYPIKVPSQSYTGLVLRRCTINGNGRTSVAVGLKNYALYDCDVFGGVDLFRADGNVTIDHCWLHGLARTPGSHNDCIQILKGSNIKITRNRIEASDGDDPHNSCLIISAGANGGPVNDVLIEGNLLSGGNYTLYLGEGGTYPVTNVVVRNNVFTVKHRYGAVAAVADDEHFDRKTNVYETGTLVRS